MPAATKKKPARIFFSATPKQIEIHFEDRGEGFNIHSLLRRPPPELATEGRGVWIMKNLVDQMRYRRGSPNRLILIRKLVRPKSLDAAMELFERLHHAIQRLKPVEALYEEFIDFIVNLFNVERASFLIFRPEEGVLRVATSRGISKKVANKISIVPGKGIAGYVFKSSRPLLVHNLSRMKKEGPKPRKKGYTTKSFVSVPVIASPLQFGEETVGVLNLTDKRDGSRFTKGELKLLSLMAGQAASAFRIRDLIDAIKQHEGLTREFEIVREIQDRLIPVSFPKLEGIKVGGVCRLSPRGGGDYYEVIKVGESLRGVIADVSGHHVGSALTMASFRSTFRSMIFDPNSPGQLLRALRWAMHEELVKLHHFISCWTFEYSEGSLKISGAGHPPVMVYRSRMKKWESFAAHHLPLGLEDDTRVQNKKVELKKEDWVFFYTDGLLDPRMRSTGFDREIFQGLVQKNLRSSPQKLVEKIFQAMSPHHLALAAPDDVALLILKIR